MNERARWLGLPLSLGLVALAGCADPSPHAAPTAAPIAPSAPAPSPSASAVVPAPDAGSPAAARCREGRIHIPAGTFRMGSAPGDKDAKPDEQPAREVSLRAYCIDRTEVTVASYAGCSTCSPASAVVVSRGLAPVDVLFWSKFCNAGQKGRPDHPVNCVDWKQASAYCKWAGGRLPSEAEWEYAARGKDGRKYPWGDDAPSANRLNGCGAECAANATALGRKDKKTMFDGNDGAETTAPVGRYPEGQSPFGVLDMAGNVWEWTADGYAPYDAAATDNPVHDRGPARVVRGGHWLNANPQSPRAANRESRPEEKRLEDVGFRCVSALDP